MSCLATINKTACIKCGHDKERFSYRQLAMVQHGGFGAHHEKVLEICACTVRVVAEYARNPRDL